MALAAILISNVDSRMVTDVIAVVIVSFVLRFFDTATTTDVVDDDGHYYALTRFARSLTRCRFGGARGI